MGVPERPHVCELIRSIRRSRGLSQEEVARRLGLSLKAYRAYETFREPRLSRLRQLEELFELPEGRLVGSATPGAILDKDTLEDLAERVKRLEQRLDVLEARLGASGAQPGVRPAAS
jgi:transcriptional regulator with XRE-family HTH domain